MNNRRLIYSDFLLRRLHSLSGLAPLTLFIYFHFYANAYSQLGREPYNRIVDQLRGLPFLIGVEWAFILGPFVFHMLWGIWIVFSGQPNPLRNNYARNWAYLLQRITAMVVFVFVIYHVVGLHYLEPATNRATGQTDFYTYLHREFQKPLVYWWYMVGIACTVFHIANGLCTFLMTWGVTVGQSAQRKVAYAMALAGVVLLVLGVGAVNGFLKVQQKAVPTPSGPVQVAASAQPAGTH